MTLLRFGPDTLRASRFGLSPLAETLSTLVRLRRAGGGRAIDPQVRELRTWLKRDPFADGLLQLVAATKYLPDFVAIPPVGMETRIEDELAAMSSIDDQAARETLAIAQRFAWASDGLAWAEVDHVTGRAAEAFARGWAQFVQPDWPRRRAIMERDIHYRVGTIAVDGWRQALDGMSRGLHWVAPDIIQFSTQTHPDRLIGDDGLVFVPHTGPHGQWTCEAPPRFALVYPARGVLADHGPVNRGLARLLGRGKAAVIAELATPATPSQLAALLGVSLGTISSHLASLRDADVVITHRNGRAVYYELTPTGQQLASLIRAIE